MGRQGRAPIASAGLSLEGERRLWLRALLGFFGDGGLRDIGPIVWRFLDDHPWGLRIVYDEGQIRDLPLHGSLGPPPWQQVMGEILGFVSGKVVSTAGHMLVLTELQVDTAGGKPESLQQAGIGSHVLPGWHQGDVTCFCAASDGGEDDLFATGSADMTVRLWRGGQCLKAFTGQEWSEWTGTMYIGHVTTVTAVLVTPEGRVASGDRFGAVCIWHEDESCEMLDLSPTGAVTCLAAAPGDGFLVGHRDGDVRAATWDAQLRAAWTGAGRLLAVAADASSGRILAASTAGFSQASSGMTSFSRLVFFSEPANTARFEGGMLIICGRTAVTLWAFDGRPLATVLTADVRMATLLHTRGHTQAPQSEKEELGDGSAGGSRPSDAGPT